MSGASTYLQKMRKAELVELADSVDFKDYDGLRKSDLEVALDEYLTQNATQFSSETRLAPFYKTSTSRISPVKKETSSSAMAEIESKVKSVKRRVTKAAEELIATDDSEVEPTATRSRTALTRTPARNSALSNLSLPANIPLPPSPAVIADAVERRTQVLRSQIGELVERAGFTETAEATREALSTVVTVQSLVIAFELWNLRKEVLPDKYAFTIPTFGIINNQPYDVKVPDLFLLFTASFWGPMTLWTATSLIVPLVAAYFFNLTAKPTRGRHTTHFNYTFDPLTFSIVKALLTYVIYGQDVTFGGLVDLEYVARINSAIFGGYQGVLVGTAIGALVTVYEAVLKK